MSHFYSEDESAEKLFKEETDKANLFRMARYKSGVAHTISGDIAAGITKGQREAEVNKPIKGLQNLMIEDSQARAIFKGPISIKAIRGKEPFKIDQIVELMPDSLSGLKGKIINVEPGKKEDSVTLTIEHLM